MEETHITPEMSVTTMDSTSDSGSLDPSSSGSGWSLESEGDRDIEAIQLAIDLEARLTIDFEAQFTPISTGSVQSTINNPEQELYPDMTEERHNLQEAQTSEKIKRVRSQHTEIGGELDTPVDASNLTVVNPELVTWLVPLDPSFKMNNR